MIKRTICIENACSLKFRNEQMVVSYSYLKGMEDVPDKTVPIEDLAMLVLEHQQITVVMVGPIVFALVTKIERTKVESKSSRSFGSNKNRKN